jgi:hypothetical protein
MEVVFCTFTSICLYEFSHFRQPSHMWEEDVMIRCPACGSILVEENQDTGLWEFRYCRCVFLVDWGRTV